MQPTSIVSVTLCTTSCWITIIIVYKCIWVISLNVRQSCVSLMFILAMKVLMPVTQYWQEQIQIQWSDFFVNANRLLVYVVYINIASMFTLLYGVCVNPGHSLWEKADHISQFSLLPLLACLVKVRYVSFSEGNTTAGGHNQAALKFIAALVFNQVWSATKTTEIEPHSSLLMSHIHEGNANISQVFPPF